MNGSKMARHRVAYKVKQKEFSPDSSRHKQRAKRTSPPPRRKATVRSSLSPAVAIEYRHGNDLDLDAILELYRVSGLNAYRPVDDRKIATDMFRHANLVVSAWDGPRLVGIARTLTDFAYAGYLSDLAVHMKYQDRGIGVRLIEETRRLMGPRSRLLLFAAPKVPGYYSKIGFQRQKGVWLLKANDPFPAFGAGS